MKSHLIGMLILSSLLAGCGGTGRIHGGYATRSDAVLGPVKTYTAPYNAVPRPKAEIPNAGDPIASMLTLDASARAEAATAGTSYLLGELIAHRLHTVILGTSLEDQSACAVIRPTGFSCVNIQEEQSVVALGLAHPNG